MISHTCLIPPTGVPVEVITHWAWLLVPPWGTCRELPAGQEVLGGAADDAGVPTNAFVMPTPEKSATAPTAAANVVPKRTRRRIIPGFRTSPPDDRHRLTAWNLRATGYAKDDVAGRVANSCVTKSRTRLVDKLPRRRRPQIGGPPSPPVEMGFSAGTSDNWRRSCLMGQMGVQPAE